jgi:hypothetical protein
MATTKQPPELENLGSLITIKDTNNCLGFLLDGREHGIYDAEHGLVQVTSEQAATHNKLLSEALIKGLAGCKPGQGNYFYLKQDEGVWRLITWNGDLVPCEQLRVTARKVSFINNGHKFTGSRQFNGDDQAVFCRRVKERRPTPLS